MRVGRRVLGEGRGGEYLMFMISVLGRCGGGDGDFGRLMGLKARRCVLFVRAGEC